MNASFSFHYRGKEYHFPATHDSVYELENGIAVQVCTKTYPTFDAVEWILYFENNSQKNSGIFSDIRDCDTLLPLQFPRTPRTGYRPTEGDACVITMNGMVDGRYYWENDKISATEYAFNHEYLDKAPNKTKQFANIGGRSSDGLMPFFDVTAGGNGYIAAIGWTGDWQAVFTKEASGIRMRAGLKETGFYLEPGERVRTASILLMSYTAGEDKHNKFRRLIKQHVSHTSCTAAARDGLMAVELWGGLTSEEMKKRIGELKQYDIRFEDVWIDAGWYGQCTKCDEAFSGDWSKHTGDWKVNARVHPDGLAEVAACAKDAGMGIMLWLEPERAVVGTSLLNTHPEWFLKLDNTNHAILNYGNEDARGYILDLISNYVETLNMSCYRQDFNTALTRFFREHDGENRRGITEIKHITGMYAMWDQLLEKHPGLIIDNCSSGGRRIDIETLKRSIPFFRSDYQCNFNENSAVLQSHNANIACYLPYNGCTSKTKRDTYAIRSSYSSSWGGAFYNAIFQSMTEEDFRWAKQITDEYRSIRKYLSMDFYNHGSATLDESGWAIWQYHDPDTQSGIVMAFRRRESPFEQISIKLNGLDENNIYIYENLDSGISIEGLQTLSVDLPRKRSSTIFKYKLK